MDSVFPKPYDDDIQDVAEGMAIVIDGDNAPKAISSGQYLFIKNHSTLATGGYHAIATIGSGDAVSSSNVAANADGIVNAAYSALNSNIKWKFLDSKTGTTAINLSQVDYDELLVLVKNNRVDRQDVQAEFVTTIIPKLALHASIPKQFVLATGLGTSSFANDMLINVRATQSSININTVQYDNADKTSTATINVYYK